MSFALILDILLIALLLFATYRFMKKGFIAGIVSLVGNVVSLLASLFAANKIAPVLFENFFQEGLIKKATLTIQQQGAPMLEEFVEDISKFLPTEFVNKIVESARTFIDVSAPDAAQQIVLDVVRPLMLPIISVVLFFAVYMLTRFLVMQLTSLLVNVNKIPLLGGVNKVLGLASGVLCGMFEIIIVLCALWAFVALTNGSFSFLNEEALSKSFFYSIFSSINPFLNIK